MAARKAMYGFLAWDLVTAAQRIMEGLPADLLAQLQADLDLTNHELADIAGISPSTLARRRREPEAALPPDESERAYRLARLFELATEVLGSPDEARAWMKEANYALGDAVPLRMARTAPGVELVERLLGQVEHGIAA